MIVDRSEVDADLRAVRSRRPGERWAESVYFQYFCGEKYFQPRLSCDPTSLVRFRQALGKASVEEQLATTIATAMEMKAVTPTARSRSDSNRASFCCRICPVHRRRRPCWLISGSWRRCLSTSGAISPNGEYPSDADNAKVSTVQLIHGGKHKALTSTQRLGSSDSKRSNQSSAM